MDQAIKQLSTTRATFNRWLRAGKIKGLKVGRQWRFRQEDIDHFLGGGSPRVDLKVSPRSLLEDLARYAGLDASGEMTIEASARMLVWAAIKTGARYFHADALAGEEGVRGAIRFRIDGLIQQVCSYDARLHEPLVEELKRLATLDVTDSARPQSGQYFLSIAPDRKIPITISVTPSTLGSCMTGQIVDPAAARMDLEMLGIAGVNLEAIRAALAHQSGLVVAGGPSDSGKLVTAYSMLHQVNKEGVRTITVEDHVEVGLQNAIQLSVDEARGLDYPTLIRAASAMNPDVLMVKSLQDPETLAETLDVALSKRVICTLHCTDAVSGLIAMRNWGARGLLLGEAIKLVTAQRLIRRLCPACKQAYELTEKDRALVDRVCEAHGETGLRTATYFSSEGCEKCHGTGFLGRIGIYESLTMGPGIESALLGGAAYAEIRRIAIDRGMETLCLDGLRRAAEGVTSLREVRRVAGDLLEHS